MATTRVTAPAGKDGSGREGEARTLRGRATRARILNCALRLMWRYGYSEIGVNRLIEEAGVLKGSFYHFFPSKLDLLLAMFDHLWAIQRRQIERIYQTELAPDDALRAHIEWMCHSQIVAKREEGFVPGHLHMAAGVTLLEEYPELADKVRRMAQEHNAFIFDTLMQISGRGEAVVRRQANILLYYVAGAMMQGRLYNSLDPIHEIPTFTDSLIRNLQSGSGFGALTETGSRSADLVAMPQEELAKRQSNSHIPAARKARAKD